MAVGLWGVSVRLGREFWWHRSPGFWDWTKKPSEALCFYSREEAEALAVLIALGRPHGPAAAEMEFSAERLDLESG